MRLKCDYCDHYLADTDERCPNCGAPNRKLKRNAVKIPQTIEELQAFAEQHNLPLDKMHFHIGEVPTKGCSAHLWHIARQRGR